MKIITRQTRANEAAANWMRQYKRPHDTVLAELQELGPTPDPDAVDAAIGNKSWTMLKRCDECGEEAELVQLGQEPDYDSATASICGDCLLKALRMLNPDKVVSLLVSGQVVVEVGE